MLATRGLSWGHAFTVVSVSCVNLGHLLPEGAFSSGVIFWDTSGSQLPKKPN